MPADSPELLQQLTEWAKVGLEWVGFGTLTGLLAKAIMPGKDPGGAVATLSMGVGGTVIGCGVLSFFSQGKTLITPISAAGFCVATGGAFIILFFYKLLGGYYFREGEGPIRRRGRGSGGYRSGGRTPTVVINED
ncbi:MAG: GlsB/YeaQ/YmgE family stress response membrane protein [Planctomycetales bacterium]|nr:GlsB/YeaQ/YmgE family stress response membrane protein [Planctomycetales bacterium]